MQRAGSWSSHVEETVMYHDVVNTEVVEEMDTYMYIYDEVKVTATKKPATVYYKEEDTIAAAYPTNYYVIETLNDIHLNVHSESI